MTVSLLFFVIAGIIGLGFAGKWLFRLTRIPDSLLLIAAGFGLREVFGLEQRLALGAAPYFGAFALVVILFEGGLHLGFEQLLKGWRHATRLMVYAFLLSGLTVFLTSHLVFGRDPLNAALLASVIACTSAAIVIPLVRQALISPHVRTILELESSLSDALAVLFVATLLQFLTGNASSQIGMVVFSSLTGAIIVGVGVGLIWMIVLRRLAGQPLTYLLTFAVMLVVYAVCEGIHSSGVFGVFLFGLTFSNGPVVLARLRPTMKLGNIEAEVGGSDIKGFHAELTFLVRTFFFVFLGLLFDLDMVTPMLFTESVALYAGLLMARWAAIRMCQLQRGGDIRAMRRALFLFMPRGLASAVLATLPASHGVAGTEDFVPLTVLIVFYTNLVIALGMRSAENPN